MLPLESGLIILFFLILIVSKNCAQTIIIKIKLLMEEGGSKAEFPLTHQLLIIGVGDLPLLC